MIASKTAGLCHCIQLNWNESDPRLRQNYGLLGWYFLVVVQRWNTRTVLSVQPECIRSRTVWISFAWWIMFSSRSNCKLEERERAVESKFHSFSSPQPWTGPVMKCLNVKQESSLSDRFILTSTIAFAPSSFFVRHTSMNKDLDSFETFCLYPHPW